MNHKHSNPSHDDPRRDSKTGEKVRARAPYNFISLPEKVVTVDPPPDQSIYSGFTGCINCEIVTRAPTYIRGMASPALIQKMMALEKADKERKAAGRRRNPDEKKAWDEQERQLKDLNANFFEVDGLPLIPGSSLRGMIRNVIEIITYSKVRWVGGEPTFSFRAVAAQNDDPLKEPYQALIGSFGKNVRAGYLHQKGERWVIRPARLPADVKLADKNGYIKVKERVLLDNNLAGYVPLNHPEYQPQIIPVSFTAEVRTGGRGDKFTSISKISATDLNLPYKGTLVCSGNMLESGKGGQTTRRKNQAIVLEPAPGKEIPISERAVQDYKRSLTTFQRENLSAWKGGEWGCLREGAPVFFVWSGREEEVVYFGHSPNFRVPVRLPGADHASNPLDFIPAELQAEDLIDCADALFGWTPESGGKIKDNCAGRVFFSDAKLVGGLRDDIWHDPQPIAPHVLSGPKATTFQHYLVQDRALGHDPDVKRDLAHYGTPANETQIRGRKYYWHRGKAPKIEADDKERQHESQLTRIRPLKSAVRFAFQLHFENLRDFELGALLWALQPRGSEGETYVHKIGMGKPLGMGAVQVERITLTVTDRSKMRYNRLFSEPQGLRWNEGAAPAEQDFANIFERFMLSATQGFNKNASRLADLVPVQDLLTMMAWRGDDPTQSWLDWTRYMQIEHGTGKLNEYKERPVLPTPAEVIRWNDGAPSAPAAPLAQPAHVQPQADWPPKKGTILIGTVLDDDPRGKVSLSITGAVNAPGVERWVKKNDEEIEIVAEIQPKYRAGKKFAEGRTGVRLIVMASERDKKGWLILCRPAN